MVPMLGFRCALIALAMLTTSGAIAQSTPAKQSPEQAKLSQAEKAYVANKKAFEKKPKDAALKKNHVESTTAFGEVVMNSPLLPAKDKYPKALRLFREALALDPKNKKAKDGRDLIEGIYRSMGRPIPK